MTANRRPKAPARPVPPHWQTILEQKGLRSVRALSQRTHLDHVTVNEIIYGDRQASERSIQEIAGALGLDMGTAYRLMGRPANYLEPWTPPACSARMDREQRKIVEDLVYVLVEGHRPGMTTHAEAEVDHPERKARGVQDTANGACEVETKREGCHRT